MDPPGGARGGGLHWFRVSYSGAHGRCYITNAEAQHLRELTAHWVERAIRNLEAIRGREWIETRIASGSGLMIHHSDAYEPAPAAAQYWD